MSIDLPPAHHAGTRDLLVDRVHRTARRRRTVRRLAPVGVALVTAAAVGLGQLVVSDFGHQLARDALTAAGLRNKPPVDPFSDDPPPLDLSKCLPDDLSVLDPLRYLPMEPVLGGLTIREARFNPGQCGPGDETPYPFHLPGELMVYVAARLGSDGSVKDRLAIERGIDPGGGFTGRAVTVRGVAGLLRESGGDEELQWTDDEGVSWRAEYTTDRQIPDSETAGRADEFVAILDSLTITRGRVSWNDLPAGWTVLLAQAPPAIADPDAKFQNLWTVAFELSGTDKIFTGGLDVYRYRGVFLPWQAACRPFSAIASTAVVAVRDGQGCLSIQPGTPGGSLLFDLSPGVHAELILNQGSASDLIDFANSLVPVPADDPRIGPSGG